MLLCEDFVFPSLEGHPMDVGTSQFFFSGFYCFVFFFRWSLTMVAQVGLELSQPSWLSLPVFQNL